MKKTLVLSLLILSALALTACGTATVEAAPDATSSGVIENAIMAEGRLEPVEYANLSFSGSGVVAEVMVFEGDTITAGELIAQLENTDVLVADLENADTEFENAETVLLTELTEAYKEYRVAQERLDTFFVSSRFEGMNPTEAVEAMLGEVNEARADYEPYFGVEKPRKFVKDLKEILDNAWSRYNSALEWVDRDTRFKTAELRLAQAQKNYADFQAGNNIVVQRNVLAAENALSSAELRTRFGGTVADLNVKVGEAIGAGSTAVTIADFSNWIIKTSDLSEVDIVNVQEGQSVIITLDALPGVELAGTVESISSTFENTQGDVTYEVTISLQENNPAMRWGMTALVEFVE